MTRPIWEAALESQFTAVKVSRMSAKVLQENPEKFGDMSEALVKVDRKVVKYLPSAAAFAWRSDLTQAVWESSASIPGDAAVTSDLIPEAQVAWWWFEWPLPMEHPGTNPKITAKTIRGLMLVQDMSGLVVIEFRDSDPIPLIPGMRFYLPCGLTIDRLDRYDPDSADDVGVRALDTASGSTVPEMRRLARFVLAACVFLRQRIVQASEVHIERHFRKRIEREHPEAVPSVKIITLRRAESSQHDGGETRQVEWSCQWIVQGHWRNQKIKEGHRLIYIENYIKGPDDKPLRVHPQTVFEVKR
jgi:hypothetical protein